MAATPVRQVPGAFFNTPAPAQDPLRRDLFGAGANSVARRGPLGSDPARAPAPASQVGPPVPPQPVIGNTPPAQRAARLINELLQLDASFPDLDSTSRREFVLLISQSSQPIHADFRCYLQLAPRPTTI